MTRREIIEAAKQLVILHGPANIIEFVQELVVSSWADASFDDRFEIELEAERQAGRVYAFLGYDNPTEKS